MGDEAISASWFGVILYNFTIMLVFAAMALLGAPLSASMQFACLNTEMINLVLYFPSHAFEVEFCLRCSYARRVNPLAFHPQVLALCVHTK